MKISTYFQKFLNYAGYAAFVRQFGTELKNLKVEQDDLEKDRTIEDFNGNQLFQVKNGGAASGTTGHTNIMLTDKGNIFEYNIKGTQTKTVPTKDVNGLDISLDQTANDGVEFTQGIAAGAKHAYKAQTDRFFIEAILKLADVSGSDDLAVGFRKAEAYQAAIDDYDEMMALNVISGNVNIETILNNGSTITTDTTDDVDDNEVAKLRLEYDDRVGLQMGIELANELKSLFNLHLVDSVRHTTAPDTVNTVTANDARDFATLIALTTQLLTKYVAHDDDAELASDWVYHAAQEGGDCSLVSAVAPTTLALAIARLNDLKTKLNAHNADNTAHGGTAPTYQSVKPYASCGFFKIAIANSLEELGDAEPVTVSAPFTFDDNEVVVPFLYFLQDTELMDTLYWRKWDCGKIA